MLHRSAPLLLFLFVALSTTVAYPEGDHASAPTVMAPKKDPFAAKRDAPDEYQKFHRLIRTARGADAPTYREGYRVRELGKMQPAAKTSSDPLPWIERGPANVSGRSRSILVDPRDPDKNTWYLGSVSGGVWKTEDAGNSWRDLTADLPNLATTSLAQSASDPDIIYLGTGEGFGNVDAMAGDGMWKSTDGGETWTQLDASANNPDFAYVMRIVVDPNDPDVVVAATRKLSGSRVQNQPATFSIQRSDDGGATWAQAYRGGATVDQVVANPLSFQTLYAAENGRSIRRSNDGGKTWRRILDASAFEIGGRMELAVSPVDTAVVYVSYDAGSASGLLVSFDGGATWKLGVENDERGRDWLAGQGWYNNALAGHPYDANQVFVSGVDIFKLTIESVTDDSVIYDTQIITDDRRRYTDEGDFVRGVHVDHHVMMAIPMDEQQGSFRLLSANDGGLGLSDDQGMTWAQTGTNQRDGSNPNFIAFSGPRTAQFYGIDKMNGPSRYLGGTQDNGSWTSRANTDINENWVYSLGGDGFEGVWHYENPSQRIYSFQFNGFVRTMDSGATFEWARPDDFGSGAAPFISRIGKSRQDADLLFVGGASGIWRSDDFGGTWQLIDLPPASRWPYSAAMPRISLASPQVIWYPVGGSSPDIYRSTDGGWTFEIVSIPERTATGPIVNIATHPTADETAFALFAVQGQPKVGRTDDGGRTWRNISGVTLGSSTRGFPDVAAYDLVVMPFNEDQIWVGTEIGIAETLDGGRSWQLLEGFPAAPVWDLEIVNDEVVAGTHGRGLWSVSLPELEGYEPLPAVRAPSVLAAGGVGDVSLRIRLRAAYDSSRVSINGETFLDLAANTGPQESTVTYPVTEAGTVLAELESWSGGERLYARSEVFAAPAAEARDAYSTSFEANAADFYLDGLTIGPLNGFTGSVLHSPHPHPDDEEFTATLLVPIELSDGSTVLSYDDVALVEPGESGSVFGDFEFWDYVVVEGSSDNGASWQALADGYDARENADWANNLTGVGDSTLFVHHEIELLDQFSSEDTVLIRFRLSADASVNYWGWAVDNLRIEPAAVTSRDRPEVPGTLALSQNYPNPFRTATTIAFELDAAAPVSVEVYDLAGRRVRMLMREAVQPAGSHRVQWDATTDSGTPVASGMYLYRLTTGEASETRQMVVLR